MINFSRLCSIGLWRFLLQINPHHTNFQLTITAEDFDKSVQEVNSRVKPIGLAGVKFVYTDWMAPDTVQSYVTALDRMVGDYQFTCPVIDFAQSLAKTNLNERFVLLSNSNKFWVPKLHQSNWG